MPDFYLDMLMREASHRTNNLLSVVQVMARHTAGKADPRVFAERFSQRLGGLAASHDLLIAAAWRRVDIADLVRAQLTPFGDLAETRVALDGPHLGLRPAAAQSMGMALHELTANAAQYGSLSSTLGAVLVEWDVIGTGLHACFKMRWTEHGGPAPKPAPKRGFGHTVMVEMVGRALDANVRLAYPPSGVVWELTAPLEWTLNDGRHLSLPSPPLRGARRKHSESTGQRGRYRSRSARGTSSTPSNAPGLVGLKPSGAEVAKDVRDFERRALHDGAEATLSGPSWAVMALACLAGS